MNPGYVYVLLCYALRYQLSDCVALVLVTLSIIAAEAREANPSALSTEAQSAPLL